MERKKIFGIFGGFLAVMLVFTILSRAVSGAAMAKVETVKISTGTIDHKVMGSGKAEAGKEIAVYTEAGQRVKEICVQEGQSVEEGEVLFLVDLQELEEQILAAEQELEKLKLQGQDAQSAQSVERQNRQNARNRAAEDYNTAVAQGNGAVSEAKAAWDRAEQELQQFIQNSPNPGKTSQAQSTIVPETDEGQAEKEGGKTESGEEQDLEADESQKSSAHYNEESGTGKASQENGWTGESDQTVAEWETRKTELEEAVAQAKAAYQEALSSRTDNVKNAARALEDASTPIASDSTGKQNEITRQQQEVTLHKLSRLKEAEGKVKAPVRGMVTNITITTGDFTTEGTAIRLADTSKGCRITAYVNKTDEKYVSKGSPVTITASGSRDEISDYYTISNIADNEEDKMLLDVSIDLPEGVVEAGTTVDIEIQQKSQNYNTIIPIEALHEELTGYYVMILQEEKGVMGSELVAKRFEVEVLDKNGTKAALAEGMLTGDQEIISSSSRSIEDGSRVRRKAE